MSVVAIPRTTPFHERTSALNKGAAWRRWAGHISALSYELNHDYEYAAIRNTAGLLDVSPLYKYMVEGRDAERLLDRIVTRDMTRCQVGQVVYTSWCTERGRVLDDGTIARLEPERFRLTSADPNYRWLVRNAAGLDVRVTDVSHGVGALALQGPAARRIIEEAADDADIGGLRFFRIRAATIGGAPVTISRTGYTGDLGYEIWLEREHALRVWDALMVAGEPYGLVPAGLLALDVSRIEAGFVLLGVDYVSAYQALVEPQTSTPYELGLGWTVSRKKEAPYVGRAALDAERERGPEWHFVGVELDWESLESAYRVHGLRPELPMVAWRTSVPLYARGRQVGYCTSGCWSPLLKKYIALGHVRAGYEQAGRTLEIELTVEHFRTRVLARIAPRPFFDPERKRAQEADHGS